MNTPVLSYRGRTVTAADLDSIRALLAAHPELSRRAFSQRLCEHWDWRQPSGALRDLVARSLLLALHRAGHIALPPVRQQPPNNAIARRPPAPVVLDTAPLVGTLRACQPLELRSVRRTPQEGLYDALIAQYHYLGPAHGVGEQVKYLAFSQGRPLACLGFSCAPRHLGPRDRFIGWSPAVRRAGVHLLGYNTRFLILPWVRVPHLASHLLGSVARRIAADWQARYGHPVHYLETFVDPERFHGTCYRAANWQVLGLTTGRGKDDCHQTPSPQSFAQARAGVAAARGLPPLSGGGGVSRRKHKPTQRLAVPIERLEAIVERTRTEPLPEDEHAILKAAVDTLARVTEALEAKTTTLQRVRHLLFGPRTETTDKVLGKDAPAGAAPPDTGTDPGGAGEAADSGDTPAKKPRQGHGRNGAADYPRAPRIAVPHASLQHGDPCPQPGCTGRVYVQRQEPAVLVRVTGVAPLQAQVYELERLRCGLCGTVFTAAAPAGLGETTYDETATAMIALLKYGSGLPFHRITRLEAAMAIPLPETTQWDVVQQAAPRFQPAFDALVEQAAQAPVVYNDDTTMRILKLTAAARAEALPAGAKAERTGVFTTAVVAETIHGPIALFKTGPGHAGEHLAQILDHRQDPQPPIQMSDALARNTPGAHPTQAASCIPHGRRKFVAVHASFPEEVTFVLESLRPVFRTDQQAKRDGLSPEARLLLHQRESGPRMQALHDWMDRQIMDHLVEPNSGLGQAITYMQNHWEKLTLFLRVPGPPLDNNLCEQALKKAILHRKNALFYRTLNGAKVGDLYMSLIYTAELHRVGPFDYLVTLLRHATALALDPAAWMPWNYTETLARRAAEATATAPQ